MPTFVLDGSRRQWSWAIREECEEAAQRVLEVAAIDDHVDLAVLEEELGALEAFGQRLADRLRARDPGMVLFEAAAVGERGDALARGDAKGITALRAHASTALDLGPIDDLL